MIRRVLGKRLLVTEKKQEKTQGGVILADTANAKNRFEVFAKGSDVSNDIMVGDIVVVPDAVGNREVTVPYNGARYQVIDENTVVYVERNTN